jgi:hypothetical protein
MFPRVDASLISEMKDMAEENRRLNRMYAEMSMQNDLLKEALGKKPYGRLCVENLSGHCCTMRCRAVDGMG